MTQNFIDKPITYSGNVILKIVDLHTKKVISQKFIKNAGTYSLFKFIGNCLINQFETNNRPRYIDASAELTTLDSNGLHFTSTLYYRSLINNIKLEDESHSITLQNSTIFTQLLPHVKYSTTILKGQIQSNNQIKSLVLSNSPDISDNSESILAWINLPETDQIQIGDNQALFVEWDLSFNNYVSNELDKTSIVQN